MASTVLPNGIIIPEKFSRDWYADLYHNWQELDNLLGGGTPKDGTLTIQKNGTTVGTFSANQSTNETINITVPDVNNGTLTIQKNGTAVGTFSANQATDETVNITVPDVNDGTLTIQQNGTTVDTFTANSSSDKTVNIQCVDLTNNQTVGGNKEFTGTTTAHDILPSTTDTYNLGSSTKRWKSFNGINPGALSLPSSTYINVDTTNWDLTCSNGQLGSFTPTADGWLMLNVNNGGANEVNFWIIGGVLRINNKSIINLVNNANFNMITIPVGKGKTYNIYGNASEYVAGRSIAYCRFMPCQGNV